MLLKFMLWKACLHLVSDASKKLKNVAIIVSFFLQNITQYNLISKCKKELMFICRYTIPYIKSVIPYVIRNIWNKTKHRTPSMLSNWSTLLISFMKNYLFKYIVQGMQYVLECCIQYIQLHIQSIWKHYIYRIILREWKVINFNPRKNSVTAVPQIKKPSLTSRHSLSLEWHLLGTLEKGGGSH